PEECLDSGPLDFEFLFFDISFRQQDEVVPGSQVLQRLSDSREQLQGLSANTLAELANLLHVLVLKVFFGQAAIGFDQALREIDRAIAHQTFHFIQHRPYLLMREARVVEEGNKGMNGLLKI